MHKLKEAELIFNLVLNQNLSLLTAMVSPKRDEVLLNNGDIQDGLTDKVLMLTLFITSDLKKET